MILWIRLNDELNSDPVLRQHDNRIVMDAALIRPIQVFLSSFLRRKFQPQIAVMITE